MVTWQTKYRVKSSPPEKHVNFNHLFLGKPLTISTMSALLPIFQDQEFVPHAFLDAIIQQLAQRQGTTGNIDLTSTKDLQLVQSSMLSLLNQLDLLSSDITSELEENVKALENTNSVISYSYQSSDGRSVDSKLKPTSRLEYYVDSLGLGINSLNEEVNAITVKKCARPQSLKAEAVEETVLPSKIGRLLELSKSKEDLQEVVRSLNTIKSIIDIAETLEDPCTDEPQLKSRTAPTSTRNRTEDEIKIIKPNEFQLAINVLKETIIDQFNSKLNSEPKAVVDLEFLKRINDLIKISEVLRNFGKFSSIYNQFANFLKTEKKNYLNGKQLDADNNDELFKEVLK